MNLVDIKMLNRSNVYQLIYTNKQISKPEIAAKLKISLPTVTQCVNELKTQGLVNDHGFFDSTGGRKAAIITCCENVKIAIGVEILKDSLHLVAVNLFGDILCSSDIAEKFSNDAYYCARIGNHITKFFISLNVSNDTLLGVGIAIQGLVDESTGSVCFGKILNADGFSVKQIEQYVPFPCTLRHDTELAAAFALWHNPAIRDALYLVLNKNVGGAVIINGKVYRNGKLPSGLAEHMILVPNGRRCYCGRCGCMEMYCSTDTLGAAFCETTDAFFGALRANDKAHSEVWQTYLHYLAAAIYNCQIMLSTEVVLGGSLARYFLPEDLKQLTELVLQGSIITDELPHISVSQYNDTAAGAALLYIEEFLQQFGDNWIG